MSRGKVYAELDKAWLIDLLNMHNAAAFCLKPEAYLNTLRRFLSADLEGRTLSRVVRYTYRCEGSTVTSMLIGKTMLGGGKPKRCKRDQLSIA